MDRGRQGKSKSAPVIPVALRFGEFRLSVVQIVEALAAAQLPLRAIVSAISTNEKLPARNESRAFAVLTTKRYRQIVECFEEIADASLGEPRTIPHICAALGIGHRTLARAVRAVRGTTPARHLHARALAQARAALQDPATRSVRQVARRCGFRELGRFAADYRATFGENPSETLRRASGAEFEDNALTALCDARR